MDVVPARCRLAMHSQVHLEVYPIISPSAGEWALWKHSPAFQAHREGSGGLFAGRWESVIQVQKQGQCSHPGDPCMVTDSLTSTSTEQARRQADPRAEAAGDSPFWPYIRLQAPSCSFWSCWFFEPNVFFPRRISFIMASCRLLPSLSTSAS